MAMITELDLRINLYIQENWRSPFLDGFLTRFTKLGNYGLLPILLTLIFFLYKKWRTIGATMALSLVMQFLFNNMILKVLVARVRPYEVCDKAVLLVEKAKDYSFPSGHTGSFFAVAVVLFLLMPKRYGFIALGLSFLMGFSRVYVGIHYPTDILGGIVLGSLTAVLAIFMENRIKKGRL